MKTIKIFGYGSLINKASVLKTCPSASNFKPVILKGFIRIFNARGTRFCKYLNKNITALNIEKDEINNIINGVLFEIDETDFISLQEREEGYEIISVEVEEFDNELNRFKALTFHFPHFEAEYSFLEGSEEQNCYLNICLEGADFFGEKFYEEFLETTLIDKESKLLNLLELKN